MSLRSGDLDFRAFCVDALVAQSRGGRQQVNNAADNAVS